MTITREQVADLRPGDVVELRFTDGYDVERTYRGALRETADGSLYVSHINVRTPDGEARRAEDSLTVISRAKPPLYVNSDRTEPVPGDVVRDADSDSDRRVWMYHAPRSSLPWPCSTDDANNRRHLPDRLRLLVDGTTGMPPAVAP